MALTTVRSTGIGSLPAISGANLTSLTAGNLTGTLPAISGANLTGISAGKIGQVVQATRRGEQTMTSTSFSAFNQLQVAITPTASSSKILIMAEIHCHTAAGKAAYMDIRRTVGGSTNTQIGITADSSAIQGFSYRIGFANTTTANGLGYLRVPISYLDTPSTTDQLHYCPMMKSETNGQTAYIFNNGNISTLICMEVLA
jgi:hypothetical protein